MTRKKVKLAFIANDSARKATFKKRKKGLMKKVSELSTLCGIDACAIIYSQYESQPDVWPNTAGAQSVMSQFKRMPEMEQSKKMVNQESFTRQRIVKASEQLKKQHKDNREREITEVMHQCLTGKAGMHNLTMPDLNDLGCLVDQNLKEINKRIESLKKLAPAAPLPSGPPPLQSKSHVDKANCGFGPERVMMSRQENTPTVDNGAAMDGKQRMHWFTDLVNNPNDYNMSFNNGDEMVMLFGDSPNPMWSSAFFP